MSSQDELNSIHAAYGYTDTNLATSLGVTREYISRLRHGFKQASTELEQRIHELYLHVLHTETPRAYEEAQQDYEQLNNEIAIRKRSLFGDVYITHEAIILLLCLIAIVGVCVAANKMTRHKQPSQDAYNFTPSYNAYDFTPSYFQFT